MSYSQDVYNEAKQALDRRKERATIEAQERTMEISQTIPELESIQAQLSQIGVNISKVFLYSKNKQADIEKLMEESLALQDRKKELLVQNGYDENALAVKYTCDACNDTGYINNRKCKCHKELLKDIERANLAKLAPIEDCTFDSFKTEYYPDKERAEKIKSTCIKYGTQFTTNSKSIIFYGGTGLGKTHLSLAIANAVINRGYSVIYGTAQNILSDLQNENFGRYDNLKYDEVSVLNCDLLILDDLGTEFKSGYTTACLYNIINSRILAKLPTIISTNFTSVELEEKYDQRVTSRIIGEFSPITLTGNDIRYIKR